MLHIVCYNVRLQKSYQSFFWVVSQGMYHNNEKDWPPPLPPRLRSSLEIFLGQKRKKMG